jgi:hypothetical protein
MEQLEVIFAETQARLDSLTVRKANALHKFLKTFEVFLGARVTSYIIIFAAPVQLGASSTRCSQKKVSR